MLFPVFQLQSNWVAGVLSGRIELPSQEEMMKDVAAFYSDLEARGCPKRYTHDLGTSVRCKGSSTSMHAFLHTSVSSE